ncbi:uncharacterized protein [Magallana gigas]|uniref:uncharacterized protein n=1 Tax=Magallana gigas TaxID=29159 RepID=UPI00333E9075
MMATKGQRVGKCVAFNCPICLEQIIKPKRLPCSHTFCQTCLQIYITRDAIGKENDSFEFKCPVCRRLTGCPENGIPVEEWAKHFPANSFLASLNISMAENPVDKLCAVCLRNDKQVKAESWCHDCSELICNTCKSLHKSFVSLQKHKISTAAAMHDDQKRLQVPDVDEPCCSHVGKFVEVFCLDHDKLCCSICFATQHRHCKHVEALEDIAEGMPKSNIDWNIEVLIKIAKNTKETIEYKEQTIKETIARKEEILTNVNAETENLKSRLDECQQQFEKIFLKTHEDNEEKLKQSVLDLRQYLLVVKNGEALLSAIQQKGSTKQKFITAMKIINDVEQQFQQFKANYPEDEEIQYEHDHTTILKQVCTQDKIEDVTEVGRPSGTIWKLSTHLPSFRVLDNIEQKELSTFFQNLPDPNSLKAEKISEFQISGSAHQGVFVNSETFIIACSSPFSLKAVTMDGTMKSFEYPIELKGKPCLDKSINKNVLYVGCPARIFKLKITERKPNELTASCLAEINVREDFETFCVDEEQNKIVVAKNAKVTTFTLFPFLQVQTATIQISSTFASPPMSVIQDRFALVIKNEIICFLVSGQELFRYQIDIPYETNINCIAFDPSKNLYAVYSKRHRGCDMYIGCSVDTPDRQGPVEYYPCEKCHCSYEAHIELGGVNQVFADGCSDRSFISNVQMPYMFLFFNDFSKECVISDGNRFTVHGLYM